MQQQQQQTLTDRERALQWAYELVKAGNWVSFDTETTGFDGDIISWAVCAPDGSVLGEGFVKPTVAIEEGAFAVHKIKDEDLMWAPGFREAWPKMWALMEGKTVVIYNAQFDIARLHTSARAVSVKLPEIESRCAMMQYAMYYGERNYRSQYGSRGRWKWQRLEHALSQLGLDLPGTPHTAAYDAAACAAIVRRMAELYEQEEPPLQQGARSDGVEIFDSEKGRVEL